MIFLPALARTYGQGTSKPDTLKPVRPDSTVVRRFLKSGEIEVDYGKFFTLPFRFEKKYRLAQDFISGIAWDYASKEGTVI